MANKENLSPLAATRYLAPGSSKLPLNASSSIWNQAPPATRTPPLGLSPSKNPVLHQQRDHSACRRTDSPLKVRKTRENLKQAAIYTDVPPPCVHGPDTTYKAASDTSPDQLDTSGSTLVNAHEDEYPVVRPLTPAPAAGRMQRHKSVSRRMLSRVREGISHRSRSSQSMRATSGTDTGLMRRLSGKTKQNSDEQPRVRSFEVSRDSIDSLVEGGNPDGDPSTSYRSFTDCSISTESLMGGNSVATPPRSRPLTPIASTHTRQYSGRLLSPSPGPRSPSGGPTPRPTLRSIAFGLNHETSDLQATIPFVDLAISVDRDSIDVDLTTDMWVAIEGTVRSRVNETSIVLPFQATQLRKRSMDAVIIVTQDAFGSARKATHKCIVELCSRLNIAGDRLAVLCARVQQTATPAVNCECEQLHALQSPSLTRLFERLGIAPSTADAIFEEHWQSLPDALQALTDAGLRKDRVQTFIISRTPDLLVQIVDQLVQWPAHAFKIGLASELTCAPTPRTRHSWAVEIKGDGDENVDIYDNMIKDLRHGCPRGTIPSVRICYKPMQGCRILDVVGQKALRDVRLGQRCSLFLKIQVPRVDTSRSSPQQDDADTDTMFADTDALFAELESIVGVLETNIAHVEARYRHSMLPNEHVVTERQICKIRRPKSDSRWSIVEGDTSLERVHGKLAQFLAMHYPPARAVRMIDRWVVQQPGRPPCEAMQQVREHLDAQAIEKPSVVVTDIDSAEDTARQLWRHIRHQSLSAKQLADGDGLQKLEESDENIKALRHKALTNKRSLGAETLRAWKWEERMNDGSAAPWL